MFRKPSDILNQSSWRRIGAVAVTVAGVLAVAAVPTRILRDTVVHLVRIVQGELPEGLSPTAPFAVCIVYWLVFLTALTTAVYMAFLDFRYIRLQYTLEKRKLFRQSMGDDMASSVLSRSRGDLE